MIPRKSDYMNINYFFSISVCTVVLKATITDGNKLINTGKVAKSTVSQLRMLTVR